MSGTDYPAKQRYVGTIASDYDRWRLSSPLRRYIWGREFRLLEKIAREQIMPNSTILDAPTGTGRFVPLLRKLGHRVAGTDISLDMLRVQPLRDRQTRGNLVRADCETLPFCDGAFDYVISMRFLGHVPPPARSRVLQEFKRVASRGIVVGFPVVQSITRLKFKLGNVRYQLKNRKTRCWWPATPQSLPGELESAGLKITYQLKLFGPFSQIIFLHLTREDQCKDSAEVVNRRMGMASAYRVL